MNSAPAAENVAHHEIMVQRTKIPKILANISLLDYNYIHSRACGYKIIA